MHVRGATIDVYLALGGAVCGFGARVGAFAARLGGGSDARASHFTIGAGLHGLSGTPRGSPCEKNQMEEWYTTPPDQGAELSLVRFIMGSGGSSL
jgi:hypothetical protein